MSTIDKCLRSLTPHATPPPWAPPLHALLLLAQPHLITPEIWATPSTLTSPTSPSPSKPDTNNHYPLLLSSTSPTPPLYQCKKLHHLHSMYAPTNQEEQAYTLHSPSDPLKPLFTSEGMNSVTLLAPLSTASQPPWSAILPSLPSNLLQPTCILTNWWGPLSNVMRKSAACKHAQAMPTSPTTMSSTMDESTPMSLCSKGETYW